MGKNDYDEFVRVRHGADAGFDLLAQYDPKFFAGLKGYYADGVLGREDGAIARHTKELVIMVCAAAKRSWDGTRRHMGKALDHGAKPREVLEFLEAASINAGVPVIWRGSQMLAEELKKREIAFE